MPMKYNHINCKSALHVIRHSSKPFHLDLNIYRGCEHKCQYCFAIYSHRYMNNTDYFNEIFIKDNIAQVLDKELSKRKSKDVINIGGICDSYQPIEAQCKLMREVLQVMIKHKNPIIISTKSDLILRDLDLIKELAEITAVNIAATITCMDETTRKIIEPNGVTSERRFAMLEKIKKETKAIVGVHIMPIIPYLSDSRENLTLIYQNAERIKADYVLPGTLYLRGNTRNQFFQMVDEHYPQLKSKLINMYNSDRKGYKQNLYRMINELKDTYHISHNYMKPLNDRIDETQIKQLSLF